MALDPISWLIIGAIAAGFAVAFWDDIRDKVAAWLRQKDLSNSALMDAWVKLDLIAGQIRCQIFGKTKQYGTEKIAEATYSKDEIRDRDVISQLERIGHMERNIMSEIA